MPAVERRRDDRGADRPVGLERPLQAAGVGAQRVHHAAGAADEHLIADHRRLRERRDVALEAERPFQLQLRHLIGGQTGERGRRESRVVARRAPAVPGRTRCEVDEPTDRSRQNAAGRGPRLARQACRGTSPPPRARRGAADRRWSSSRRSRACAGCASPSSPAACRRSASARRRDARGTRRSAVRRLPGPQESGATEQPLNRRQRARGTQHT